MEIYQVDAFTDRPFAGNPAAVCTLSGEREEAWMQNVAAEMNLAETAFLLQRPDGWGLRWFTPELEVDLCGHATLASAHVLWEAGRLAPSDTARFHTKSGLLTAARRGDEIELDFPEEAATESEPPRRLLEALGLRQALWVGQNRLDFLVEVESEKVVRNLRPDFRMLKETTGGGRGVMVTSRSASPDFDFVSRFFAPAAGIDEDPVTGSAHCALGPYWASKLGKRELRAYQASARGGSMGVRVRDDGRVSLIGRAVTVLRGELLDSQRATGAR
jgi:PhzF family phenazine biosynthesis protein